MRRKDAEGTEWVLEPGGLTAFAADATRRFLPAPPGYTLSHFGEGITVVGRGEEPVDGWWDWIFEVEGDALRRVGPAY
ncbi:MAG TPA: hypothetical protein VGC56_01980 [Allosphingosinicella sp.]|jgi:hypothetical protein